MTTTPDRARGESCADDRVLVPIDRQLYAEALQAAAYYGLPPEEWFDRAAREKLAAEPIRSPADGGDVPRRTPYLESGVTTRDTRSSAG